MSTIFGLLDLVLGMYGFILLARALISWFPVDRNSSLVRFLYLLTEPVLEPIRALLPTAGMVDFSPMVAMLIVFALQQVLRILAG